MEIKERANRSHHVQRLEIVNGALVCLHCDKVPLWPSQKYA